MRKTLAVLGAVLFYTILYTPQVAESGQHCWGPYTLNSANFAPDTNGDNIFDWVNDFTVDYTHTSGTISFNVEAKTKNGGFNSLGTVTGSGNTQFHGPFARLRFNVTTCTGCLGAVEVCGSVAGP